MHVDVEQASPAHHHQRVAQQGELPPDSSHRGVVGLQEVLDLVGEPAASGDGLVWARRRPGSWRHIIGCADGAHLAHQFGGFPPRDGRAKGIQQEHDALSTRVDHPRFPELRQLVLRSGQGGSSLFQRRSGHLGAAPPVLSRLGGGARGIPHDRQNRALGGPGHGSVRLFRGAAEGSSELPRTHGTGGRGGLAQAPEDLGQDHARVPPGGEQRGPSDDRAELFEAGSISRPGDRRHHGFLSEEQVGARVAVGDRVDVERVQFVPVLPEGLDIRLHGPPEDRPIKATLHHNRR